MKLKYDPKVDAIYIELGKGRYSQTKKISDTVMVDQDKKGKILGVEILDARKNIPAFDPKKIKLKVVGYKSISPAAA